MRFKFRNFICLIDNHATSRLLRLRETRAARVLSRSGICRVQGHISAPNPTAYSQHNGKCLTVVASLHFDRLLNGRRFAAIGRPAGELCRAEMGRCRNEESHRESAEEGHGGFDGELVSFTTHYLIIKRGRFGDVRRHRLGTPSTYSLRSLRVASESRNIFIFRVLKVT